MYSGFVANSLRPLSLLIVANPERGKSTEVQKWKTLGVFELQDATSYGIDRHIQEMSGEDLDNFHHLVIPDLEKLASRNRAVRNELLAKLRILMEEGIQHVSTGRDWLHLDKPLKLGVIMCTTPDDLGDRRSVFRSLSFQSRLIPITYDVSDQLKLEILDFIGTEEHIIKEKFCFKRKTKVKVKLSTKYAKKITPYAITLARELENFSRKSPIKKAEEMRLLGIRCKENLMTLLKSIALYHGRKSVDKSDFEEFRELYRWMNYDFNDIDNPPAMKLDKFGNFSKIIRSEENAD